MLLALFALNLVLWSAAALFALRLLPRLERSWTPGRALLFLLAAGLLTGATLWSAPRLRQRQVAQQHYWAGIDEQRRGNLEEAERHFGRAVSLQPGNEDARRRLEEIRRQRPAERRVQEREVRVQPVPSSTPPRASGAPPAKPSAGTPGDAPRPVAHLPSPFEIAHYALDVTLDPESHAMEGAATFRIRSRKGALPRLDLSLHPEFRPTAATVDGQPCRFTHLNDLLTLTPRRPVPAAGESTVTVRYGRASDNPLVGEGQALIAPAGSYFLSEARWYPATGELDFRAPVRVRATVPRGYTAVSVGALRGVTREQETTTFHWETDRFASMVSLAAARYVSQSVTLGGEPGGGTPSGKGGAGAGEAGAGEAGEGGLRVTCYTFPEHRGRAAAFLKEATAITRFFTRHFGPYPYEKLAVVEIPYFPGGYGTSSFVMLIDKSFEEKRVDREFLAHEIAHQWWGNSVFPQGLGAAWLTEAFSNYSAWLYAAAIGGNPRILSKRVRRAVEEYYEEAARRGDQAIYETDPYQQVGAAQAILYEKGAVVLHMLRGEIGDRAFFRSLRVFADRYRFGKATIADFQRVVEQEAGRPLAWFFDQWLGRKGGMALSYTFATEPHSARESHAVLTLTQPSPPYRAKLKVVMEVDNTVRTETIELSRERESFRFPVRGKVTSLLIDPDSRYLMSPPRWEVPDEPPPAG